MLRKFYEFDNNTYFNKEITVERIYIKLMKRIFILFFENTQAFYYLLITIALILLALYQWRQRKLQIQKYLGDQADFLISSISTSKRLLKLFLCFLVLIFLILSLARLQGEGEKREFSQKGSAILIMLDISHSMLAEDVRPNRLTFVKQELSRLIDISGGDQIALGFFAKSAFLVSPFTPDLSAIQSYLKDISTDYLSHQGTDFSNLFDLADKTFKRQQDLKFKVLVIASDGEDHSLKTKSKVQSLLKEQNIRVFTLSVGTESGKIIPIRDYKNQVREYKKDSRGELVISRFNPDFLKKLSQWGKGAYYHLDYGNRAIKKLREDLNLLKKQSFDKYTEVRKKEYYQWFLIIAVILALGEIFLNDRKKQFNRSQSHQKV